MCSHLLFNKIPAMALVRSWELSPDLHGGDRARLAELSPGCLSGTAFLGSQNQGQSRDRNPRHSHVGPGCPSCHLNH